MENESDEEVESSQDRGSGGKFVDTFRHFHPTRTHAFTCWSTLTGARQTNYGTRIDYIFASRPLVEKHFQTADIMPEVEGSDHCPVWAQLSCTLVSSPRCPSLCTRYMPEFAGTQQKLSRFLVKVSEQQTAPRDTTEALPGSQEAGEISENINPARAGAGTGKKRPSDGLPESSTFKGKRSKTTKTASKPQGSLLAFFKPKPTLEVRPSQSLKSSVNPGNCTKNGLKSEDSKPVDSTDFSLSHRLLEEEPGTNAEETDGRDKIRMEAAGSQERKDSKKGACPDFWKAVLHGPPQPPLCKDHNEPCVLRTVKKAGPNLGRQFFVCARPQGHTSNPEARCNFFAWVDKGK